MMIAQERQPYLKTRHDLDFQFFGSPTVVHASGEATDGRFFLMEATKMPPGLASPYHVHHNEDEAFYILDGHVRFVCGGEWLDAGPGTWVYGPREIPHGFKVVGAAPARMLLMCAPAGFEKFVLELCAPLDAPPAPPDLAKLMAVAARFNIDVLGPLPDDPGDADAFTWQRAVDQTRDRHMAAVNAGDAVTATSLFAPNGILLPPGQPALEGLAAISGWFAGMFANFQVEDFTIQPDSVEDRDDLIIEHGSWSATFAPKNASSAMPAGGTYLSVYERLADGSVRYVRDTFNGLPGRG
jgi:ketosteroid isomerase-like protein/mannose-6-phosphate isomerase-like protein (cupin superfamily)